MPFKRFINSAADVGRILTFSIDSGMMVRDDSPQLAFSPRFLSREECKMTESGNFYLIRPEWIYGEFVSVPISAGINAGKYMISPGVNHASIAIYFAGELVQDNIRRIGSGSLSYTNEWLEQPGNIMHKMPVAVAEEFRHVTSHFLSSKVIRAGVHKYFLTKGVIGAGDLSSYLPPFDFIPWPPNGK